MITLIWLEPSLVLTLYFKVLYNIPRERYEMLDLYLPYILRCYTTSTVRHCYHNNLYLPYILRCYTTFLGYDIDHHNLYLPYILRCYTTWRMWWWQVVILYLPYILRCYTTYSVHLLLFQHLRVAISEKKSNSRHKNKMFYHIFLYGAWKLGLNRLDVSKMA